MCIFAKLDLTLLVGSAVTVGPLCRSGYMWDTKRWAKSILEEVLFELIVCLHDIFLINVHRLSFTFPK